MKISVVLLLLLHFYAIDVSHSKITNCSYINNRTDSVEIHCENFWAPVYGVSYVAPAPYHPPAVYRPPVYHPPVYPPPAPYYPPHRHRRLTYDPFDSEELHEQVHEVTTEIPRSACYIDLFESESKEKNRQNVKLLKPSAFCGSSDQLGELFPNIRELECFLISKYDYINGYVHTTAFKHLTKLNASNKTLLNINLMDLNNRNNLKEIDYSYNFISQVVGSIIDRNTQLAIFNISHNHLNWLPERVFDGLIKLKVLDMSYNKLFYINRNAFQNNKYLEVLRLDNNPLTVFDCFMILSVKSLTFVTVSLDKIEKIALNCVGCFIGHTASNTSEMVIRLSGIKKELHFTKDNFKQLTYFAMGDNEMKNISEIFEMLPTSLQILRLSTMDLNEQAVNNLDRFNNLESLEISHSNLTDLEPKIFLNKSELKVLDLSNNNLQIRNSTALFAPLDLVTLSISNSHLENIQEILQSVTPSIIKLDLSFNYVGKLNGTTFQRFTNLQYLNLSHTNLSNFGFNTFYHQTKLQQLDLSYNNLMRVDFHLLGPCFRDLTELYLEGNHLTDISSMNPTILPKLTKLAISKNQVSCHSLIPFLQQWNYLNFIGNPSTDQTHMYGIDCSLDVNPNSNEITTKTMALTSDIHISTPAKHEIIVTHAESHVTKYSILFLCLMCCGYFIVKSKFIPRIKEKLENNSLVNKTTCQPATSTLVLMEQENL